MKKKVKFSVLDRTYNFNLSGTVQITSTSGRIIYEGDSFNASSAFSTYLNQFTVEYRLGVFSNCEFGKRWPLRLPRTLARDFEEWLALRVLSNLGN